MKLAFENGAHKANGVIFEIMKISDNTSRKREDLGTSLPQDCLVGCVKGATSRLKFVMTVRTVVHVCRRGTRSA